MISIKTHFYSTSLKEYDSENVNKYIISKIIVNLKIITICWT